MKLTHPPGRSWELEKITSSKVLRRECTCDFSLWSHPYHMSTPAGQPLEKGDPYPGEGVLGAAQRQRETLKGFRPSFPGAETRPTEVSEPAWPCCSLGTRRWQWAVCCSAGFPK